MAWVTEMLKAGISVLDGGVLAAGDTYAIQPPLKYTKKRSMRSAWIQVPCLAAPLGWWSCG